MLRLLNLGLVIKIENKDMYSNKDITKIIKQHFPFVSDKQLNQFEQLPEIYGQWNEKINVVSRKDIENILLEVPLYLYLCL